MAMGHLEWFAGLGVDGICPCNANQKAVVIDIALVFVCGGGVMCFGDSVAIPNPELMGLFISISHDY